MRTTGGVTPTCPPATRLRKPFLVLREAAFFLQVKKAQACYLYETGRLPAARLDDGSEWVPFDKRLVRAIDFFDLLDDDAKALFVQWQLGTLEMPRFDPTRLPPPLSALRPATSRSGGYGDA